MRKKQREQIEAVKSYLKANHLAIISICLCLVIIHKLNLIQADLNACAIEMEKISMLSMQLSAKGLMLLEEAADAMGASVQSIVNLFSGSGS